LKVEAENHFVLGEDMFIVGIAAFAASSANFKDDLPHEDVSPVGFASLLSQVSDLDAAHHATDDGGEGREPHWERTFTDQALEQSPG
jgi:hypothetical protein